MCNNSIIKYNTKGEQIIVKETQEAKNKKEKLIIEKKMLKGEDGYKTFSIRIKEETVENLDRLSQETNRSRNELINILIDYAIDNCEVI